MEIGFAEALGVQYKQRRKENTCVKAILLFAFSSRVPFSPFFIMHHACLWLN
jgi:hypothetical protein